MSLPHSQSPKRPERIKVLGQTYRVRIVTERAEGFEEGDYGQCDADKHVISIVAGRSSGNDQNTLTHEIFHAIAFELNVDGEIGKRGSEEQWIQALATGWLAVLKDNPRLVSYLRSE